MKWKRDIENIERWSDSIKPQYSQSPHIREICEFCSISYHSNRVSVYFKDYLEILDNYLITGNKNSLHSQGNIPGLLSWKVEWAASVVQGGGQAAHQYGIHPHEYRPKL